MKDPSLAAGEELYERGTLFEKRMSPAFIPPHRPSRDWQV